MVKIQRKKRHRKSKKKIKRSNTHHKDRRKFNSDHAVFAARNKRTFSISISRVRTASLPAIMENELEPQFTEKLSVLQKRRKTLRKRIIITATVLAIIAGIIIILLFVIGK